MISIGGCFFGSILVSNTTVNVVFRAITFWGQNTTAFTLNHNAGVIELRNIQLNHTITLLDVSDSRVEVTQSGIVPIMECGSIGVIKESELIFRDVNWVNIEEGLKAQDSTVYVVSSTLLGTWRWLRPDPLEALIESGLLAEPLGTLEETLRPPPISRGVWAQAHALVDMAEENTEVTPTFRVSTSAWSDAHELLWDAEQAYNAFSATDTTYHLVGASQGSPILNPNTTIVDADGSQVGVFRSTLGRAREAMNGVDSRFQAIASDFREARTAIRIDSTEWTGFDNHFLAVGLPFGVNHSLDAILNASSPILPGLSCVDPGCSVDGTACEVPSPGAEISEEDVGSCALDAVTVGANAVGCAAFVSCSPTNGPAVMTGGARFLSVCAKLDGITPPGVMASSPLTLVAPLFTQGIPVHPGQMLEMADSGVPLYEMVPIPDNVNILLASSSQSADVPCGPGPTNVRVEVADTGATWTLLNGTGAPRKVCVPLGTCTNVTGIVNVPLVDPEGNIHWLIALPPLPTGDTVFAFIEFLHADLPLPVPMPDFATGTMKKETFCGYGFEYKTGSSGTALNSTYYWDMTGTRCESMPDFPPDDSRYPVLTACALYRGVKDQQADVLLTRAMAGCGWQYSRGGTLPTKHTVSIQDIVSILQTNMAPREFWIRTQNAGPAAQRIMMTVSGEVDLLVDMMDLLKFTLQASGVKTGQYTLELSGTPATTETIDFSASPYVDYWAPYGLGGSTPPVGDFTIDRLQFHSEAGTQPIDITAEPLYQPMHVVLKHGAPDMVTDLQVKVPMTPYGAEALSQYTLTFSTPGIFAETVFESLDGGESSGMSAWNLHLEPGGNAHLEVVEGLLQDLQANIASTVITANYISMFDMTLGSKFEILTNDARPTTKVGTFGYNDGTIEVLADRVNHVIVDTRGRPADILELNMDQGALIQARIPDVPVVGDVTVKIVKADVAFETGALATRKACTGLAYHVQVEVGLLGGIDQGWALALEPDDMDMTVPFFTVGHFSTSPPTAHSLANGGPLLPDETFCENEFTGHEEPRTAGGYSYNP